MKLLTKFALAGAALAASTGAYADVALPSAGLGQAVLFVKNETTGAVYARGIDLSADQVATQAAIVADSYTGAGSVPDTSLSFSLAAPIGPDTNLTNFLNAPGTNTFSWGLMLADSSGGIAIGDKRAFGTSVGFINTATNTVLNQGVAAFNTMIGTLNGRLPDTGPNSTAPDGMWDSTESVSASTADIWFSSSMGWNNKVPLVANQVAGFYLVTMGGGTTGGPARQYYLGDLTLSLTGTLSSVVTGPEVPLPPAIWMLGSALAGFAGLRRRRVDVRVNGAAA